MQKHNQFWPRAIIHIDMNAFFAAVEQLDFPQLRNKPIAVTNGARGTCIITCSYEARAFGIKTGMRLQEARQRCRHLVSCPARPHRYAEISRTIMTALRHISPDIEIFSVDEAFLDVTACQKLWGTPERIGQMVKEKVYEVSKLTCSVGVSGDKTTAKYAANLKKPDGFTVIHPAAAKDYLSNVPVSELCGIGAGITRFLAGYGVLTCGDMERLPIGILAKRFGNLGRRLWYMCQGADPERIQQNVVAAKSMGHGKVIPPNTEDLEMIFLYLTHMSNKLTTRMRKNNLQAQHYFIGVRNRYLGWIGGKKRLAYPSNDHLKLNRLCRQTLKLYWSGEPISQVQITALDPHPVGMQSDLFEALDEPQLTNNLNHVIDDINNRFGSTTLMPARIIKPLSTPDVIAPAWKPHGHRQSIR